MAAYPMRLWFKHPATLATGSDLRHWLARNQVSLAGAGVHADLGWAFPVEGKAAAEWISFETERLLGRVVVSEPGAVETTAARRSDGKTYVTDWQKAASAEALEEMLVRLIGHLRLDRDAGLWWQAPGGEPTPTPFC
jgi:hypothetical protein